MESKTTPDDGFICDQCKELSHGEVGAFSWSPFRYCKECFDEQIREQEEADNHVKN